MKKYQRPDVEISMFDCRMAIESSLENVAGALDGWTWQEGIGG